MKPVCTSCCRPVPPVPGMAYCCVAHVAPNGEPCLDGQHECKPGDTCTEWAINMMAARAFEKPATQANRDEWQERNLSEIEL